jgi:hypothetical protein
MSGSYEVQHPLGGHWPNKRTAPEDGDISWRRTLWVSTPFLLIGLSSIFATYLPYNSWQVVFGVMVLLVLCGALGVAWIKGFPFFVDFLTDPRR